MAETTQKKTTTTSRKRQPKSEVPQKPIDSTIGDIDIQVLEKKETLKDTSLQDLYVYFNYCKVTADELGDKLMLAHIKDHIPIQASISKLREYQEKVGLEIYNRLLRMFSYGEEGERENKQN